MLPRARFGRELQGGDTPQLDMLWTPGPHAAVRRRSWTLVAAALAAAAPLALGPAWSALGPGPGRPAPTPAANEPAGPLAVATPISVALDGRPIPAHGLVVSGEAFAPAAALAQALGGFVVQSPTAGTELFVAGHVLTAMRRPPGLEVDGAPRTEAVPPFAAGGQVYMPVRALAAALGEEVSWNQGTQTASVNAPPPAPVPAVPTPAPAAGSPAPSSAAREPVAQPQPAGDVAARPAAVPYAPSDLELIGRVIHGEADGQPYLARVGVAAVIVNRVRSHLFPATITGVVYAPGQFQAVGAPLFEEGPDAEDLTAALAALHGQDPTGGALYFYNPATTWAGSWIFTRPTLATYGAIRFAA